MVIDDRKNYIWNPKQETAKPILGNPQFKNILFYGGSRAGKTFLICYFIRHRARTYYGSKHLISRFSFAKAKKTLWLQTLYPLLLEDEKLGLCKIQRQPGIAEYKNGSLIILDGLEPSRIDGVLGAEYGTIFINEANENKFEVFEQLQTRLNDTSKNLKGKKIDPKIICDLNPTFKKHWTNILFKQGIDPSTQKKKKDKDQYTYLHWKPEDNINNLAAGYIETLKNLGTVKRQRFYEGEYGDFEGLIFDIPQDQRILNFPNEYRQVWAGLDFGFDHPAAMAIFGENAEKIYVFDALFQKGLSSSDFIQAVKQKVIENKIEIIYCDPSRPDYIKDLRDSGINAKKANNSIFEGIVYCKGEIEKGKVFFNDNLTECLLQMDSYVWNPNNKDHPLKEEDDFPDSFRYGLYTHFKKPERENLALDWA